ncbi:helicase-related protein [uncultured Limosilactobacillus sp.]|uniref:DEAD/DEAH box helicase n=1 Tax=uncultured Limosilactobacillus sp. TaxID=2837629 RepID=UPI0025DABED3|nr:helicase-related protein [uncultured Limosilactobacillus sp.]
MALSDYYGRRVLATQTTVPAEPGVTVMPTMEIAATTVRCLRCNTVSNKSEAALPHQQYYCRHCLQLGRVSTLAQFYHVAEPNQFPVQRQPLSWHGQLSPLQARVSAVVCQGMANHQRQLLWAVTGAGKTEMIFAGLSAAIGRGERVAVASPRVDVCLELFPRLQKAFTGVPIALLHGRQEEKYHYRQLTVCTTHQLLRFYHAFDNLVVDEVDAFPYASNQALLFATGQAVKKDGGLLMMTATPGPVLLREIRRQQMAVSYLPLRYHGHPLPSIKEILVGNWRKQLHRGRLPVAVHRQLKQWVATRRRFLLFVPHVADLEPVANEIRKAYPNLQLKTVYAADPQRLTKVAAMRQHQVQALITTTILERGVTFPGIDLGVLGADDPVFSSSALVQIAGRVGRAKERPTGNVCFWVSSCCRRVNNARRQITALNQRGRRLKNELSIM